MQLPDTSSLDTFHKEWPLIKAAPYHFAIALAICVLIVWLLIHFLYRNRLEAFKETVEHLKSRSTEAQQEKPSLEQANINPSSIALARSSNARSRAIPHPQGTFDSKEFFRTAFYSTLQDVGADSFRNEAERERPHDKESFYLDVLAVGSLAVIYNDIWYPLFRSQLLALLKLNKENGVVSIAIFRQFYNRAAEEFASDYKNLDFDNWMRYLTNSKLVIIHPSDMVEITEQGKDFLKYLLHWGKSEETKRL